MRLGLDGRVALVTGGSRGIGRATAAAFAAEGARVAITYAGDPERAEREAARLVGDGVEAMAVRFDLSSPDSARQSVAAVTERWGSVDVLVANAVRRSPRRPREETFESVPDAEWRGAVNANLSGHVNLVRGVLPGMRERSWGRIVFVSSHVAFNGAPGQEVYGAVKAALHGFSRSLAWDVAHSGVLVNTVAPGLTLTEGVLADLPERVREDQRSRTPGGRLNSPDDVAAVIAFLGSDRNRGVNGELVTVTGGR